MTKVELRKYIREQKKNYSSEQLSEFSAQICSAILSDGLWRASSVVLLYHALPDEVDLSPLLTADKTILLPVVVGDDLILRRYHNGISLRDGAFGIKEPEGDEFTDYNSIQLAIVPGIAFDIKGNRLGRGKGYYDRLLPRLPKAWKIGVCFPFQLQDKLPSELHDVKMNEVVSRR